MVAKRTEKPLTAYGRRIEKVMRACGYTTKADFAKAVGETQQNVHHWMTRPGDGTPGAAKIRAATGVSADWLLDGEGEPAFPSGPTMFAGARQGGDAGMALTLNRLGNDVQALRYVVTALVEALIVTTPAAAEGVEQLLSEVESKFQGVGFVGQIQASVARARDSSAAAPRASRPRAAPGSGRRGSSS